MLRFGKQILYWLVLVVTGMALIGVNVTQSSCIHSDRVYLEVKVVPVEKSCPCEEGCICCEGREAICGGCCHKADRHDFYKITDSSVVERYFQVESGGDMLPECYLGEGLEFLFQEEEKSDSGIGRKIPEVPPSPERLCTFLC